MRYLKNDLFMAFVFLVISVIAILETVGLSLMSSVFPRTVGTLLLIFSLIYYVKSMIKPKQKKVFSEVNKKRVLTLCVGLILYLFLIWTIGLLCSSFLFMAFFTWYFQGDEKESTNKLKITKAVVGSFILTGSFYALFRFVFSVPLPEGMLFKFFM